MMPALAFLTTLQHSLDSLPWRTHAYIVGICIALTCSLLSTYIVLRRMALISEGVSHAGFGGIGVALVLGYYIPAIGTDPASVGSRVVTGLFCLATALLINYVTRGRKVSHDSAIGIFLVATVALGDILLNIYSTLPGASKSVGGGVEQLLFGNFLAARAADDLLATAMVLVCCTIVGLFYNQFLYATLDEEMARVNGVNTRLINFLLLAMISLVIVIGVRMVGFLMITAMTIIPAATANMLSRRFGGVLLASLAIGVLGTVVALVLALNSDTLSGFPAGPILVLTLFAIFVVVWTFRQLIKPRLIEAPEPAPDHDHATHSHGH